MTATKVNQEIFKAYDIRGLYGEQMDGDTAYAIGRAFARVLAGLRDKPAGELKVGLGRDMRLTAPEMSRRVRDGLVAEGCTVFDAGMVGTEMLYYLVGSRGLDGGAMVTASHNPKAYTGIKLVREEALALSGDTGIGAIRDRIVAGLGEPAATPGSYTPVDVYDGFRAKALEFINPEKLVRRLKVVVDGGNGMAGVMAGPILERLNVELVTTYWRPDGEFPDHEPNPLLPENREAIISRVLAEKADLGIAWDGDADRCFFIDGKGNFVDGDFLTALLAAQVLAREPGARILYDVRASRAVANVVSEQGGTSNINRVGHAFFKQSLREQDAAFGGEVSGHYYFRDFWCADSGTIPALLILEMLAADGARSLAEYVQAFNERYFISGEINSTVTDPQAKMDELVAHFADGELTTLDGISVDYPEWHFNVRPSNTEPLLRLNLESLVSRADMEMRRDEILGLIRGN